MPGSVPQSYYRLLQEMSRGTGIPISVLINQANLESGFRATAVSSAGAEGWLQFLPSTYNQYAAAAHVPKNTEFNPANEAKVYIQFMNALLTEFHGNLREALAAYNAGPGNIGAGMGYAAEILGNYSGLVGARPSSPPMDAHQLHLNHLAQTAAAGRTPMNRPRLGAPTVGPINPVHGRRPQAGYQGAYNQTTGQIGNDRPPRTVTPGGAGMRSPVTSTVTAHQAHIAHLAHLAQIHHTGANLPARTSLQGGKTPPPTNRGAGGTRVVNR